MFLTRRMAAPFVAAALSALCLSPALAIEPKDAAKALGIALADGDESRVTYEQAATEGTNVVITGLAISGGSAASAAGGNAASTNALRFDRTVIESPADGAGDVLFTSPHVTFSNGAFSGDTSGDVDNASLTDLQVLKQEAITSRKLSQGAVFSVAEANNIHMRPPSAQEDLTVAHFIVHSGNVVDDVAQQSNGSAENVVVPASFFGQGPVTPQAIGYDHLVLNLNWDGARDPATQVVDLHNFTLDLKDGGTLKLSGKLGNIPIGAAAPDQPSALAAQAIVHNLTVRYEDHSLANRILKAQADQQGMPQDKYVQQLTMALPFLLGSIGNQQFAKEVADAVTAFLQKPQSLTVTLAPNPPLSGAEITQLVQTAPDTLPDRLQAHVKANAPQ